MAKGLTRLLHRAAERAHSSLVEPAPAKSKIPASTEHPRDLLKLIRQAQESERRRVARELHDSVNQILSSVQFRLQVIEEKLAGHDEANWRETLKTKALLEKAIQEVRRISRNLRPSELDDLGLEAALCSLCREFTDRTGIAIAVSARNLPANLGADIELNLYRIIQEALTNIEKHSAAHNAEIIFLHNPACLEVTIRDNGRGFVPAQSEKSPKPGMGLVDMRERAASIGGTCTWQSAPRQGTKIVVRIPLPAKSDEKRKAEKNPAVVG